MTNAIHPGDTIVCIDDSTYAEQYLGIKAGETYTCRWIGPCRSYLGGDYIGVRLAGINRGVCPQFGEQDPPFRASRFRPLVGANDNNKVKKEELV